MRTLILATLLAVALTTPAAAQRPAPSPERVQAAEQLLQTMDMPLILQQTMDAMMRTELEKQPELAQVEDIMRDVMRQAFDWEQVGPEFTALYAEVFTADEMRELGAFYGTPLGRRVLATQSELGARGAEIGARRMQELMPQLQRRVMERMMPDPGSPPLQR